MSDEWWLLLVLIPFGLALVAMLTARDGGSDGCTCQYDGYSDTDPACPLRGIRGMR